MIYFYLAIVLLVCVLIVYSTNRKKVAPTQADEYGYPSMINRKDFEDVNKEIIVISFTSSVCDSCKGVWSKVQVLNSDSVAVQNVEYENESGKKLHQKYSIDAVPTTIVCNKDGITLKSYIGSVTATDLWAGVASARGADIEECSSH